MASRRLFPAGLMVIIVVLVLVHEACSTNGSHHHCSPSSCGNIRNISYPFRLEGDPKNCGDQRYTLSCENNQAVLYLYAGKYYVQHISYANYTIRVVDAGIQNDNDSFIPRYSLDTTNFSARDPFRTSPYPYRTHRFQYVSGWYSDKGLWFPYATSWNPYRASQYPYENIWNPYQASRYPYEKIWNPYQRRGESDGMVFVKCEKPVNSRGMQGIWGTCARQSKYISHRGGQIDIMMQA
ncbi:hypothetical protein FH972_010063 [Carpinus fangiana]|uniref:Wall-associated receptor kinase galacturonan-binding domain-containing protein n=1 Tax=Carpinus fangiana TaxID=176857 RepID=A0A660KM43_9ROSI|nr:hypothetical protein FH972_010063 [Carpinus fangiana]